MSTDYYYLKEPVTGIEIVIDGERAEVKVMLDGEFAGALSMPSATAAKFACGLLEIDRDCPIVTNWGGAKAGCVVNEYVRGLDPSLQLVSEYGDVRTVAEIRALAGKGKKP